MGVFVSVRGWIEADSEQMSQIRQTIQNCDSTAKNYLASWCFSNAGGFSHFVFFGCTIREQVVDDMRSLLQSLAAIYSVDDDITDYPDGIFHVEHEDDSIPKVVWKFVEGRLVELENST